MCVYLVNIPEPVQYDINFIHWLSPLILGVKVIIIYIAIYIYIYIYIQEG